MVGLYDVLCSFDENKVDFIIVEFFLDIGVGFVIMNRLMKVVGGRVIC